MVIHVMFKHGISPYFDIPMPKFVNGWRKMWFFLRDNTVVLLPMFTGNLPIHNPTGGTRWLRRTYTSYNPRVISFNSYGRRD
jgi:hypothetical protein